MALDAVPITRPAPWSPSRLTSNLTPPMAVGLAIIVVALLGAFLIPAISPFHADQINQDNSLVGPSLTHPLGNDDLGRDVLTRVMVGYQISLAVAVGSVLLAVVIGIPLGLMAGYRAGAIDNLIMRPLDVLMAFPAILLAVVVMAMLGTGTVVVIIAIGIVYTPIIARVMRATTLTTRGELYVEAARARGASTLRIVATHILPNSVGPVVVQASILLGFAVLLEAALSFIGLGVRPPTPSLGLMLSTERDFMVQAPWAVLAPGIALMILVLGFNLVGDGLRDRLDPRGRARVR